MKTKFFIIIIVLFSGNVFLSCNKVLDKKPYNKLSEDEILSNESGVMAYFATLYNLLPTEDFRFSPRGGFNGDGSGTFICHLSEEATYAFGSDNSSVGDGGWLPYWQYTAVRNVNNLIEKLPSTKFSEGVKNAYLGEAYFIRAYYYFGMVKRYGGIPIITTVQEWKGNNLAELQVPRNTEKEVFDFIARDLDEAVKLLPASPVTTNTVRANRYAALSLKSRAMLYAASIAKYGSVNLEGILGIPAGDAPKYWQAAFDAAKAIMESNKYSLYDLKSDKTENFQNLFLDEGSANKEIIYSKKFVYPNKAHSFDRWVLPFGVRSPDGYGARIAPTLELCEQFETINGTIDTLQLNDQNGKPVLYADPKAIFANRDPRLFATVILPFTDWRGTVIDVRAGIIDGGKEITATDFNTLYDTVNHRIDNVNGNMHVIAINGVGGVIETSQTGFHLRKYVNPAYERSTVRQNTSATAYIDFRLGEVLLNYAEAAIELGNTAEAKNAVNQIRDRAGIRLLNDAEVNLNRIRHERMVELAFENHRFWDIRRWRIADLLINNTSFSTILPFYDLDAKAYIFKKKKTGFARTFPPRLYYEKIDGGEIGRNPKLIQNPGY